MTIHLKKILVIFVEWSSVEFVDELSDAYDSTRRVPDGHTQYTPRPELPGVHLHIAHMYMLLTGHSGTMFLCHQVSIWRTCC